ncbi:MAG: hypothetical protein ACOC5T_00865 [Elusimicrobiota bacterium]
MKEYTPKKWEKVITPQGDVVIISPLSEIPEQREIALIQDAGYDQFQEINANLIAAAPDLLDMCKHQLEKIENIMLDHKGPKDDRDGSWQSLTGERDALQRVLNKAIKES